MYNSDMEFCQPILHDHIQATLKQDGILLSTMWWVDDLQRSTLHTGFLYQNWPFTGDKKSGQIAIYMAHQPPFFHLGQAFHLYCTSLGAESES